MAKVDDYELRRLGQQLIDFKDDLRDILNNGRVQFSVVTAVPAWRANEGEVAFYNIVSPATDRRIYVRLTSAWAVFSFLGGGGGAASNPGGQEGSVQFNSAGIVGPIFGGNAFFIHDTTGRNVNLYGHLAVGNSGDNNSLITVTDRIGAGSASEGVQFQELTSDNTSSGIRSRYGVVSLYHVISSPAAVNYVVEGVHGEVNIPQGYLHGGGSSTRTVTGVYGVTSLNATTPPESAYGVHGLCTGSTNVTASAVVAAAVFAESDYDYTVGNNASYTLLVRDRNSSATNLGSPVAAYIDTHQLQVAGRRNVRFNIWSGAAKTTDMIYNEGVNQLAGPIIITNFSSVGAQASFQIRNNNFAHEFAGSGTFTVYVGSTTATGTNSDFRSDFAPTVSVDGFPAVAYGGTCVEVGGQIIMISSIGGATTMTFAESSPVTAVTAAFIVKLASILVEGDGPNVATATNAYPFVVSQGLGRVGINVLAPTEDLDVKGNVKVRGSVLSGALTTQGKAVTSIFTTTAIGVASNNASELTLIRGVIGTTSLVANTLSDGRTIRLQAWGYYNTPTTAGTAIFRVKLSGATILSTSNQTMVSSASTSGWNADAVITCQTTGGAGTLFAQGRFDTQATAVASSAWFLVGSSPVTFNTTGGAEVEMTFQWGSANAASQLFMSHCLGELLN